MEPEDVEDEQLSGLGGGWELGQGDVVDCILEKRSTTVRMTELPAEGERPVTKSTAMWDQGQAGTGKGQRRLAGGPREDLLRAQTTQAATNSAMSLAWLGHQKCWHRNCSIRLVQGWHVSLDACPHVNTCDQTSRNE